MALFGICNEIPKGEPGGECARTACNKGPVVGFNRSTGDWYCFQCSERLNDENREEAQKLYGGDLVILPDKGE